MTEREAEPRITGEIPEVTGVTPPDAGLSPSPEGQILSDTDLTDIPDAGSTHDIPDRDAQ